MATLELSCRCGALRAEVSDVTPKDAKRVVCHCADCQAFARWLGQEDLLDERGGSDICQFTPAQMRITAGEENLACGRLSPKGLLRFYASCCRTPFGNQMDAPQLPFVGMHVKTFADQAALDAAMGPPSMKGMAKDAIASCEGEDIHHEWPKSLLFTMGGWLLSRRLRGRHRPSPFRDEAGALLVEPSLIPKGA